MDNDPVSRLRENLAEWVAGDICTCVLFVPALDAVAILTRLEAAEARIAAITEPSDEVVREVGQRLQDHFEQHHGLCLSASEWDRAALASIGASNEEG